MRFAFVSRDVDDILIGISLNVPFLTNLTTVQQYITTLRQLSVVTKLWHNCFKPLHVLHGISSNDDILQNDEIFQTPRMEHFAKIINHFK